MDKELYDLISMGLNFVLIIAIVICLIVFLKRGRPVKKIKAGVTGFEFSFEGMDEQTQTVLKTMWGKFDGLQDTLLESKRQYKEIAESNKCELEKINCNVDVVHKKVDVVSKKVDDLTKDQQKLSFYTEALNDEERLYAGLKYVNNGHNHQMKKDVIAFAKGKSEVYKGVTATTGNSKLKIKEVDEHIANHSGRKS